MWDVLAHRLALLELHVRGELPRRKSQEQAWLELAQLGWAERASRRNLLTVSRPSQIEAMLDRHWVGWRELWETLEALNLPPDERGWKELERRLKASVLEPLPGRVNRRTATAAVARHSKSHLSPGHRRSLEKSILTNDGLVRLRPSAGLEVVREGRRFDAAELAWLLGELVITERALRDGTALTGRPPEAILLVENRGPYVDMPAPAGWLVAHVPGWDTRTVLMLLESFRSTPWVLFGDLDPNGVRIQRHLRAVRPELIWLVPEFWGKLPRQKREWPSDLVGEDDPPLVRHLAACGEWLEQEVVALDPRLLTALNELVQGRAG